MSVRLAGKILAASMLVELEKSKLSTHFSNLPIEDLPWLDLIKRYHTTLGKYIAYQEVLRLLDEQNGNLPGGLELKMKTNKEYLEIAFEIYERQRQTYGLPQPNDIVFHRKNPYLHRVQFSDNLHVHCVYELENEGGTRYTDFLVNEIYDYLRIYKIIEELKEEDIKKALQTAKINIGRIR